ncbi:MAG: hypothetical protein WCX46_00740 [Candidatus Paceibacterota bacterium]
MLSNILDRISFYSLFVVVVLLPVFFLPFTKIPVDISKGLLLIIGLSISLIFWTVARFSDGKIVLPKSWLLLSGFGVALVFLISALFSSALKISFFGIMLDTGTFYFILAGVLLMFLSSVIFKEIKNAKMVLWGIVISSAVLFIFQSLRLFIPNTLSLGILGSNTDNILGSWNALGVFAGFSTIISLFVIEFLSITKIKKILLSILILLSLIFVAIVNFTTVWWILGIFTLIIFVYKVSFASMIQTVENKRSFPIYSFVVIMITLLFLTAGQFVGGFLPSRLGISNFDIRPSFSATMSVAKSTLAHDPILGAGPNRFSQMWAMHKPVAINLSSFWNSSFDNGSGLLPTFAITTGALGILSWLIFTILLFISGAKSFFSSHRKKMFSVETVIFFVMSLYLLFASFFYVVGPTIFLLMFGFIGIYIGLSSNENKKEIQLLFLDDPRKSFFSILTLILIMIVSASACFKYIERFASVSYFQKTFSATTMENAESSINKAVSLYSNDLYLRTYAQVYLSKINSLVSKNSLSEKDKADLKTSFDQAVSSAQLAETFDKTNYLNYESLGSVYNTGSTLGIAEAYDMAIESYEKASSLNPLNPGIKLILAQVAFGNKNIKDSKVYANEALSLKQDYVDALIVLSQIAKNEGNNRDALSYAERALSFAPQNQNISQYVNSLKNITVTTPVVETTTKDTTQKKQ